MMKQENSLRKLNYADATVVHTSTAV